MSKVLSVALVLLGRSVTDSAALPLSNTDHSRVAAPGATMAWLSQNTPLCGAWPSAVESSHGAGKDSEFKCEGGSVVDQMPLSKNAIVTKDACAAWCESAHPPSGATGGAWCCQRSVGKDGDSCAWSDSARVLTPIDEKGVHSAYVSCPRASAHVLGAAMHIESEYQCPAEKMQDAMKMDGDGPGLCSQICLPHYLFGAAKGHGVTQGRCSDQGYTNFQYQSSNSGVPYNVYSR